MKQAITDRQRIGELFRGRRGHNPAARKEWAAYCRSEIKRLKTKIRGSQQ